MLKVACTLCAALGLGIGTAHAAAPDCQVTSKRMLDHLDQGNYAGATIDFNDDMKAALGTDRLTKIWPALIQQIGARGAREPVQLKQVGSHTLVVTPLHYGVHLVNAEVACDADGRVSGFFIKPQH